MRVFEEYFESYANQFEAKKSGTIKIFRDQSSLEAQIRSNRHLSDSGLVWETLQPHQIIEAEPHLQALEPQLVGGIRFSADVVADSQKFCQILRDELIASGQMIHLGCKANKLLFSGDRVIGAQTTIGDIKAKNTILASGTDTTKFVSTAIKSILIRPAKGYSLTYNTTEVNDLPSYPIVDEGQKLAIIPINGKLRSVGFADFSGHDVSLSSQRFRDLDRLTKSVYPNFASIFDGCERERWVGLRPVSADGLPYIGETSSKGLWVNSGHGHLGWTLATGSAELLANLITGKPTALETTPFAVIRST